MGKNDQVFKIILYLAIIISFTNIIIKFCKSNLVEGFEGKHHKHHNKKHNKDKDKSNKINQIKI